jgi:hypothetical protein
LQIGDKPRQGKRQGQAAKRPDPPSFGECNVCKEVTKPETKEIKDHPVAYLCSVDDIGRHTKSDQHGRSVCRLRHGSARAFGRQAFLGRAAFADEALWNFRHDAPQHSACHALTPAAVLSPDQYPNPRLAHFPNDMLIH